MKKIYYKNIEAYAPDGGIEIIPIPTPTGADKEASQFFKNHYPGYELISIMEHHVFTTDEPDQKTMYEKACYALKQMLDWIHNELGDYPRREDFPNVPVFPLERKRLNSLRGNCDYKIYIGKYDDVFVGGFCDDGYFVSDRINDKVYQYAYNDTEQKTIDIATIMASHWDHIKSKVTETVDNYKKKQIKSNDVLNNFKI